GGGVELDDVPALRSQAARASGSSSATAAAAVSSARRFFDSMIQSVYHAPTEGEGMPRGRGEADCSRRPRWPPLSDAGGSIGGIGAAVAVSLVVGGVGPDVAGPGIVNPPRAGIAGEAERGGAAVGAGREGRDLAQVGPV